MASNGEDRRLSAAELGQAALTTVERLTGYQPEAVTGLTRDGESWRVRVDVLELARIPSSTDVLGSYEVQLDDQGTLHGYRRLNRYRRCEARSDEA
jgi:Gas vesicle synthesis protein GvpO